MILFAQLSDFLKRAKCKRSRFTCQMGRFLRRTYIYTHTFVKPCGGDELGLLGPGTRQAHRIHTESQLSALQSPHNSDLSRFCHIPGDSGCPDSVRTNAGYVTCPVLTRVSFSSREQLNSQITLRTADTGEAMTSCPNEQI